MLPNFIFTEGCLPGGRAGAVGMLFLPSVQRQPSRGWFQGESSRTLFQHQTETCALVFFVLPSNQAAVEILNWFNSQLVSCRKWSHSPFLPKQTICSSGQTGTGVAESLVLLPLLSLRHNIPHLESTWSYCPAPGPPVPPAHSYRPVLPPEEQLQWINKHFSDVSCLSSSVCSRRSTRGPLWNLSYCRNTGDSLDPRWRNFNFFPWGKSRKCLKIFFITEINVPHLFHSQLGAGVATARQDEHI